MQYLPLDAKYIIGQNDPIKEHSSQFINIIPNSTKAIILRVVVHGQIYDNGIETDKCSGAYIDFKFTP